MKTETITTIDDLKFGYYGNVTHQTDFGDYELYCAEIADPDPNECWECAEWYLVKSNNAIYIAHCDGYNGIDWQITDDEIKTLLGDDEDLLDDFKESVTSFEITGDLIAAAKAEYLEDANDDYDGECLIWVEQHYYDSTINAPSDNYLLDDDYSPVVFACYADAQTKVDELSDEVYVLDNNEASRPSYRIVKAL